MTDHSLIDPNALFSTFDELKSARRDFGLEVRLGGIACLSSKALSNARDVWEALVAFDGEGWVCRTDRVDLWSTQVRPTGASLPLSAELASGDSSLHLRQWGRAWLVTHLKRTDDAQGWRTAYNVLGRGVASGRRLRYEIHWAPEQGVLRPKCFRFAGFLDADQQEGP